MIKGLVGILFLSSVCSAFEDTQWLERAKNNIDEDAVHWLREKLQNEVKKDKPQILTSVSQNKKCFVGTSKESVPQLFVFISFSVPDEVWITISKSITQFDGILLLRGLPNNSFNELAVRLRALKEKGFLGEVQINPMLFEQFEVTQVPSYVISDGKHYDKITGNLSVNYAIRAMGEKGETQTAKKLLESVKI
jgi:conjugal transfer pilus assembly protein TrbC